MKERPIIFSALMVRAILDGRKTQTRRIVKPQPEAAHTLEWCTNIVGRSPSFAECRPMSADLVRTIQCPYGGRGDRLWVRETWCHRYDEDRGFLADEFWYAASNPDVVKIGDDGCHAYTKAGVEASPWKSPLRMPRRASRIALEVTDVRVERLQSITEEDARAEGVELEDVHGIGGEQRIIGRDTSKTKATHPYTLGYAIAWDTINGDRAPWISDPWVWVVSFRRLP